MHLKDCKRFSVVKNLPSDFDKQTVGELEKMFKREIFWALGVSASSTVQGFYYNSRIKCKFIVEFRERQSIPELTDSIVDDVAKLCIVRADGELKRRQIRELRDIIIMSVIRCKKQQSLNKKQ